MSGRTPDTAGKLVQIVFPHIGYRKTIQVIAKYYGMSQQKWLLACVQAGILAAIEENERLSAAIRSTSEPTWQEMKEMGENESGRTSAVSA